jgi:formate dehydrogenase subunit gamma
MNYFVQWGKNPWNLLYVAIAAGILFMIAHTVYVALWPKSKGVATAPVNAAAAARVPEKVKRHSLAARMFHWIMAASMLTLLCTAFVPILGLKFAWVQIHWIAGLVLTASIVYHIIHATFFLDFWSIWINGEDIREARSAPPARSAAKRPCRASPASTPTTTRCITRPSCSPRWL